MPNWCMNTATITGDYSTLEAIAEAVKENRLLEYLAPIGEWDYATAVDTWGTKWDVSGVDWELNPETQELTLSFDSAWSPPIGAYMKGEERHGITVTAYYYEPGMWFAGVYADSEECFYEIDFNDKHWRDGIPQDVIDTWNLEDEYLNHLEYISQDEEEELNAD